MSSGQRALPLQRSVWWLWPAAPVLFLIVPAAILAYLTPESTYIRAWRSPKSLDLGSTLLFVFGMATFLAGMTAVSLGRRSRWRTSQFRWGALSEPTLDYLQTTYRWLVGLSLFGYLAWVANGVVRGGLRPADVITVVTTQNNDGRVLQDKMPNIAGVTTLTQAAIVAVLVGVLIDINRPSARVRWAYRLLVVLGAARALLLSERLAVLELVIPIVLLRCANLMERGGRREQLMAAAVPLLGVLMVMGVFGAAEYSRSWNFYSETRDQPFAEFATERLVGYYATSFNNGSLIFREDPRDDEAPFHTVTFMWEAPAAQIQDAFPLGVSGEEVVSDAEERKSQLLKRAANPEFNSANGVAAPYVDYGYVGGSIFFLLAGVVVGALHLSFLSNRLWGLMLYPVFFVALLELPRYVYVAQGRATPAIALIVVVVIGTARHARRTLQSLPPNPPPPALPIAVPASEIAILQPVR